MSGFSVVRRLSRNPTYYAQFNIDPVTMTPFFRLSPDEGSNIENLIKNHYDDDSEEQDSREGS